MQTQAPDLAIIFLIVFLAAATTLGAAGLTTGRSSELIVTKAPFGTTKDGQAVEIYTLQNANGLEARVMTYGAIIYSLEVPDRDGQLVNVTINRETVSDYEKKSACFGALLGRFANRISGAQFTIDGK
jgi:aldose 1-epimerase